MKLFVLFFINIWKVSGEQSEACDKEMILADFKSCQISAYDDYTIAYQRGKDGRPDFFARKACNYITASVEDCGNEMIGNCYSVEEVNTKKHQQIMKVLEVIKRNIKEWDSRKCPAVRVHIECVSGEKLVEVDASKQETQPAASSTDLSLPLAVLPAGTPAANPVPQLLYRGAIQVVPAGSKQTITYKTAAFVPVDANTPADSQLIKLKETEHSQDILVPQPVDYIHTPTVATYAGYPYGLAGFNYRLAGFPVLAAAPAAMEE